MIGRLIARAPEIRACSGRRCLLVGTLIIRGAEVPSCVRVPWHWDQVQLGATAPQRRDVLVGVLRYHADGRAEHVAAVTVN
jgi:hypothetical protein